MLSGFTLGPQRDIEQTESIMLDDVPCPQPYLYTIKMACNAFTISTCSCDYYQNRHNNLLIIATSAECVPQKWTSSKFLSKLQTMNLVVHHLLPHKRHKNVAMVASFTPTRKCLYHMKLRRCLIKSATCTQQLGRVSTSTSTAINH